MKIRTNFVSNSSSSSFVVYKRDITAAQAQQIKNHAELGESFGVSHTDWAWLIDENGIAITGSVSMDNFSMRDYFDKIGIPESVVEWGDYSFSQLSDDHGQTEDYLSNRCDLDAWECGPCGEHFWIEQGKWPEVCPFCLFLIPK
jgi:hypothetical protein